MCMNAEKKIVVYDDYNSKIYDLGGGDHRHDYYEFWESYTEERNENN